MFNTKLHSKFKLNGQSLENPSELLSFTKEQHPDIASFLKEWFDGKETIIAHTSGSTGTPKKIELKKQHMQNSAFATGKFFQLKPGTRALLCLPVQFIAGKMMLVRALTLGWELDVLEASMDPLKGHVKHYDFCAMVPLQLENSLECLDQIKKLIVGGGVVSDALEGKINGLKTEVYATYGMTETITHIAIRALNHEGKERYFKTLPAISISYDDRGCLIIDAPQIADEPIITNDLVKIHSETSFEWLGRYDSIINSGGIKLIPEQIESKFTDLISDRFFIAGIPDQKLGEKAVLIIESDEQKWSNDFLKNCKYMPIFNRYEIPKALYTCTNMETTTTGKLDKTATLKKLGLV